MSTTGHRGVAEYGSFPGVFKDPGEAQQYLRRQLHRWKPSDEQVPKPDTVRGKKRIDRYVRDVYNAMVDMTRFKDHPPEQGKRSISLMLPGKVSPEMIEARAWEVVVNLSIPLHVLLIHH